MHYPNSSSATTKRPIHRRTRWESIHIDFPLLSLLCALIGVGLLILYSAGSQNIVIIQRQLARLGIALLVMCVLAQIPPRQYRLWSPWLFLLSLLMLLHVLIFGHVGKGARRWLDLGILRFQPSELVKLGVPMMLSWYLSDKRLPPNGHAVLGSFLLLCIPVLLIAKQPDLGTALLIGSSGLFVLLLAGLHHRLIGALMLMCSACAPILWYFMHNYQRQRVLTLFNPERDPLGSGYHIIQSKIALGSGGLYGKGWLNGTQSHLQFLPERQTDFIFAVLGEEFGLLGNLLLLTLYLIIIGRGLYICVQAQETYTRLLGGSITLTFFTYVFVNIGMVSGILPVVGLPLPLVSYGGTSLVTLMAGFGILMSIHTHRRLLSA